MGYAGRSNVRGTIGAIVSYHFGNTIAGYEPALSAPFELTKRRLFLGVEIGVEPSWRALRVRPYATAGSLSTFLDCSGVPCTAVSPSVLATQHIFAMGLGLNVAAAFGPVFFGGEGRVLLAVEVGAFFPSVSAVAGVVVP